MKKKICSDITCHGKTCCHFFPRVSEHMGISNLTGERLNKSVKESAVSDHLLQNNRSIDFDHFDILVSHPSKVRLLIKESLLIKCDQTQLNKPSSHFH